MSDDESNKSSDEEVEEETNKGKALGEAEGIVKKKKEASESTGLDDTAKDLLESNKQERAKMEDDIQELRKRNEQRKKQREVEEKRLAAERIAEDERRKAAEESKKRQKIDDEEKKQKERANKMAEFEKWKTPQKRNFIINKKSEDNGEDEEQNENEKLDTEKGRKSKEQLESEKQAILKQRIKPLNFEGLDTAKLAEKAKEIHQWLSKLEGEKYDLEKRYREQQAALKELSERARQANKVGKGGLIRKGDTEDSVDRIQEKFAGTPAKVEMFSKYERQKDKRSYKERLDIYSGPQFVSFADRIKPSKVLTWTEEGLPVYVDKVETEPTAEATT